MDKNNISCNPIQTEIIAIMRLIPSYIRPEAEPDIKDPRINFIADTCTATELHIATWPLKVDDVSKASKALATIKGSLIELRNEERGQKGRRRERATKIFDAVIYLLDALKSEVEDLNPSSSSGTTTDDLKQRLRRLSGEE